MAKRFPTHAEALQFIDQHIFKKDTSLVHPEYPSDVKRPRSCPLPGEKTKLQRTSSLSHITLRDGTHSRPEANRSVFWSEVFRPFNKLPKAKRAKQSRGSQGAALQRDTPSFEPPFCNFVEGKLHGLTSNFA